MSGKWIWWPDWASEPPDPGGGVWVLLLPIALIIGLSCFVVSCAHVVLPVLYLYFRIKGDKKKAKVFLYATIVVWIIYAIIAIVNQVYYIA